MRVEPKIGIFFCTEGSDVHDGVDIVAVAEYAPPPLPGVQDVEIRGVRPKLEPETLAWELKRKALDTVVIAGDSPGHFKQALKPRASSARAGR